MLSHQTSSYRQTEYLPRSPTGWGAALRIGWLGITSLDLCGLGKQLDISQLNTVDLMAGGDCDGVYLMTGDWLPKICLRMRLTMSVFDGRGLD